MLKYIIIAIFLTNLVICQEPDDYTQITFGVNEYETFSVSQDSDQIKLSFLSVDGSIFSAYVLSTADYIDNYQTGNFRNDDVLDGFCTNFLECNKTVNIDYQTEYTIVVVNENLLLDGTLNYYVAYYNYGAVYTWLIIIGVVLASIVLLTIITVIVVIIVKKYKK